MKKLFYLIPLIMLLGCEKQDSEISAPSIYVDVKNVEKFLPASELVDTAAGIDLVALEMTDPILGEIKDVKIYNGDIYIRSSANEAISVFDQDGRLKLDLNHWGEGPGEYISITDFFVANDRIYVLDQDKERIFIYSLDGKFEKDIDIEPIWGNHMFVLGNDCYVINDYSKTEMGRYHLFKVSGDGKIEPFIKFKDMPGQAATRPYAVVNDKAYFIVNNNNTVYEITPDSITPILTVDFGEYTLPKQYRGYDARELMEHKLIRKYSLGIEEIRAYDNKLLFKYYYNLEPANILYDLKNKDVTVFESYAELGKYGTGVGGIFVLGDNNVYRTIPPWVLIPLLKINLSTEDSNGWYPQWRQSLVELSDTLTEDSNPVVFRFKLNSHE